MLGIGIDPIGAGKNREIAKQVTYDKKHQKNARASHDPFATD